MQKRMYFVFSLVIIICVLATSYLSYNVMHRSYMNSIHEALLGEARLFEAHFKQVGYTRGELSESTLETMAEAVKARLTLIDRNGSVLFDSQQDAKQMENHGDRIEVQSALAGELGQTQRYSKTMGVDHYYLAIPAKNSGEIAVIRLSLPLTQIEAYQQSMLMNIGIASVVGLMITLLIAHQLIQSIFSPIIALKQTAKRIAEGAYNELVPTEYTDEMGDLAKAFNHMTEELNAKIQESNDQGSKMNAILSNMLSVVIAVDREKRIMFMNKEAEDLFEMREEEAKGRYILEVFRNSSVLDQIKDLLKTNQPSKAEIEMEEGEHKIFNVYANPIQNFSHSYQNMGVVMIFQDITEIRKLENLRKDFVANVSHELKTPLTSIKGFVETLKNGAVENPAVRDRFLDIIEMEAMRLTHLINDLLVLSDIEKRYESGEKEAIQLNRIIDEVVLMLSESAKKKQIELITQLQDPLPTLYGNPDWIKQMLINLIDNGIKYTPNQGFVKIATAVELGHIRLNIEDNGMGIAKEHSERLFERFYRVDKARSRNIGGTGLGLAIVKHIVLAFKGDIRVTSEVDRGTTFHVRIPILPNSYKAFDQS